MFVIDHEAAFSFLYLVGGRKPRLDLNLRNSLREHLFFYKLRKKSIDLSPFIARLANLANKDVGKIFSEVPKEWTHDDMRAIDLIWLYSFNLNRSATESFAWSSCSRF